MKNGGSCDTPNKTVTYDSAYGDLPNPERTGYTFDGWYDNEGLMGTAVTAISDTETGDKIFYAKWTEIILPDDSGSLTAKIEPLSDPASVKVTSLFKPVVKAGSTKNTVTLKWAKVDRATKYAV